MSELIKGEVRMIIDLDTYPGNITNEQRKNISIDDLRDLPILHHVDGTVFSLNDHQRIIDYYFKVQDLLSEGLKIDDSFYLIESAELKTKDDKIGGFGPYYSIVGAFKKIRVKDNE